jgi:hypothetical protein
VTINEALEYADYHAEVEALQVLSEFINRLHKTADGVPVIPGQDRVWRRMHIGKGNYDWVDDRATTAKHLTEVSYVTPPPSPPSNKHG